METNRVFKLVLMGLNCANCANKIETRINHLEGVEEATLNFSTNQLTVLIKDTVNKDEIVGGIKQIVKQLEPDVVVKESETAIGPHNMCHHGECGGDHDEKVKTRSFFVENIALLLGVFIFIIASLFAIEEPVKIALYVVSYLLIGGEVLQTALRNIFRGEIFDENFLMMVATVGAFAIGEYPEAIAVMLFYEIGELFQGYAVNR